MSDKVTVDKLAWLEQIACDPDLSILGKAVAMVIAVRYLNRESGDAWPAVETLATDVGRGKTQIHEALKALELRGHLQITLTAGGKGQTNRYRPFLKPSEKPEGKSRIPSGYPNRSETQTLRNSGRNPSEFRMKPSEKPKGNPIEEPIEEPIERESISPPLKRPLAESRDAEFDQFWRVYPRREAKATARRAYEKARKVVSVETILEGAIRYAKERAFEDPKYTKHPATWLTGECWGDEPRQPQIIPPQAQRSTGRARSYTDEAMELIARRRQEEQS